MPVPEGSRWVSDWWSDSGPCDTCNSLLSSWGFEVDCDCDCSCISLTLRWLNDYHSQFSNGKLYETPLSCSTQCTFRIRHQNAISPPGANTSPKHSVTSPDPLIHFPTVICHLRNLDATPACNQTTNIWHPEIRIRQVKQSLPAFTARTDEIRVR